MNHSEREGVIVRTSLIGILTNIGLAVVKAVIGLLSNSIAVLMDAVTKVSTDQKNIVLRADKSVPIENVVALMDVLNELNENFPEEDRYKMVLATEAK